MFGAKPTQHITEYHSSYFQAWWWLRHVMGMHVAARTRMLCFKCLGSFFMIKRNGIELRTGKILEENLVQYAFQQILGDKFTFQQDNNLKHKAKYTLELLTKTTLNVPSYSFDLNRLENLWQDLKIAV
jgi:hypothetical protein